MAQKSRQSRVDLRDDINLSRQMDMELISAQTVEALYRMMGIGTGEPGPEFERQLNAQKDESRVQRGPPRPRKNLLPPSKF